jgi:hypothetical protein
MFVRCIPLLNEPVSIFDNGYSEDDLLAMLLLD